MRFPRTQHTRGEQMICSLNENNLYESRQGNLGCGGVGEGSAVCSEDLAGSFVWKSQQTALKLFRGGGADFVSGKKKETRK